MGASVEMFNIVVQYCVPNLATQDKHGNTPLHVAATSREARVKLAIVKGLVSETTFCYLCGINNTKLVKLGKHSCPED